MNLLSIRPQNDRNGSSVPANYLINVNKFDGSPETSSKANNLSSKFLNCTRLNMTGPSSQNAMFLGEKLEKSKFTYN